MSIMNSARRLDTAMTSQDTVFTINQYWIGETEAANAFGDLADLLSRMSARVAPPGTQLFNGQIFNQTWRHNVDPRESSKTETPRFSLTTA